MLRAWASLFFHIVEMVSTMKLKRWVLPFLLFAAALAMSMQVLAQPQALPLAGRTYVIDSGHGGKDDGAQREGVKEDAINLAIAKEVRAQLTAQGANVIMTREEDYDLADEDVDNRKRGYAPQGGDHQLWAGRRFYQYPSQCIYLGERTGSTGILSRGSAGK